MAGIVETIQLAGVLIFAIPAAIAGIDFLVLRGEPLLGGVLVGLAIALVAIEQYLTTPGDLPGAVASRAEDALTVEPDEEE